MSPRTYQDGHVIYAPLIEHLGHFQKKMLYSESTELPELSRLIPHDTPTLISPCPQQHAADGYRV